MKKFYTLLDKTLNYYGYKRQETLINYIPEHEKAFRSWGSNPFEYKFIKRMLNCLNLFNLCDIVEMIGIRLFFDTKDPKNKDYFPSGKLVFKTYWLDWYIILIFSMKTSRKYAALCNEFK